MMYVCILNNGFYKYLKSWKNMNIMNIQKKKICKRRKEDYVINILKDLNVCFKMKMMFFF